VGLQSNLEASVCGNDRVVPGDFAAALVGNAGLDAVAIIVLVLGKRGGNGDLQASVGVELAALLGKLFSGILVFVAARAVASIFTLALSFATAAAVHVVHILIAKQVRPICLAMHNILDLCAGHRLTEIVFGFDGGADGVA